MSDEQDSQQEEQPQAPDGEQEELASTQPTAKDPGLLASERDANQISEQVKKLADGLAQRGVSVSFDTVDINNLRPRVEAYAACQMLVAKGICTEAEMAALVNIELRAILAAILQRVEEQLLAMQQQRAVDQIVKPSDGGKLSTALPRKLAVVRH